MENPLELPVPDDPIERVHELARDLAWGAANSKWASTLAIRNGAILEIAENLDGKWKGKYPSASLLVSFEYLMPHDRSNLVRSNREFSTPTVSHEVYFLTAKAFALLEKPTTTPRIFISYKRDESSALGLLIESRLKMADSRIGIFIDKELEPGDRWHGRLEQEVRQRPYFICLLGPKSLGSKYVRNEVNWALEEAEKGGNVIIPICHNGYNMSTKLPPEVQDDADIIGDLVEKLGIHNAIVVNPEGAEQYELAMIKLLNRLGYSNI